MLVQRIEETPAQPEGEEDVRREAELDRHTAQLAEKERLLWEKDDTSADLRRQVQKLSKQLRAECDSAEPEQVAVYADPERQFSHEVTQHWLTTLPQAERKQHPLAPYRLGRDWLASLEAIELVDHCKALDVAVEVFHRPCGRQRRPPVHRFRSSEGGDAESPIRDDGAVAWRCDTIHQGTGRGDGPVVWQRALPADRRGGGLPFLGQPGRRRRDPATVAPHEGRGSPRSPGPQLRGPVRPLGRRRPVRRRTHGGRGR